MQSGDVHHVLLWTLGILFMNYTEHHTRKQKERKKERKKERENNYGLTTNSFQVVIYFVSLFN